MTQFAQLETEWSKSHNCDNQMTKSAIKPNRKLKKMWEKKENLRKKKIN